VRRTKSESEEKKLLCNCSYLKIITPAQVNGTERIVALNKVLCNFAIITIQLLPLLLLLLSLLLLGSM
jgi:hypothetical protein